MVQSEDVRDALEAIVRGRATDEAYEVIKQAGWAELVPGVVYRVEDEIQMEVATAREIITQAKKDEVYAGPMPEDDAAAVKEAESIVKMAEDAWAQHVRGPEVEAILNIANNGSGQNGGDPEKPEAEAETPTDENDAEASLDKLESVNENMRKAEPWEGYGDMTVADATEGVNYFVQANPEDLKELLTHVMVYETTHKRRVRILNHVSAELQKLGIGGIVENPEEQAGGSEGAEGSEGREISDGAGAEEQAPEAEGAGSGDVGGQDEAEGRIHEPAEAESESPNATPEPESKADAESVEGGAGEHEAEPPAENQQHGSGEDAGDESPYQKLVAQVEADLRRERSDVPKPPEESAPDLPWNWNDITDAQLQNMHMQFSSLAYYKSYVYTRDERIAMQCKAAADEIRNTLMVSLSKYDEKGKEKKVGLLEAEIETDERVRRWRKLQHKHERFAQAAKRELESYHKLVESLSRLETMRHNTWERGRR